MRAVGPRVATAFVLIGFLPGGVPHPAIAQSQTDKAAVVLTGAREALGGNERLAAVKSFVATGRTRQVRGDNLVPIEFQMSWESLDKYARRDEFPTQDSGPTTSGFAGLKWPFRIRRALGAEPVEETNFDGFRINVKVDPRRFEARP